MGIFASLFSSCGGEASPKKLDIYLMIGQSNMASRAPISFELTGEVERTWLLNATDTWEAAAFGVYAASANPDTKQGYNRYSTVEGADKVNGFSAGYPFAQTLTAALPDAKLGLVCNAVGGTSLEEWQKGAGTQYFEEAVRRTKIAMKSGTLKAILWHQGEANADRADEYLPLLAEFVADLRAELGVDESVPFIAAQALPNDKYTAFNDMIPGITAAVPNADYVVNDGFVDIGDRTHLDAASQTLLGERYAEKILQKVYGIGA